MLLAFTSFVESTTKVEIKVGRGCGGENEIITKRVNGMAMPECSVIQTVQHELQTNLPINFSSPSNPNGNYSSHNITTLVHLHFILS